MKTNTTDTTNTLAATTNTIVQLPTKNVSSTELNADLINMALEKVPTGGNAKPFAWDWVGELLIIRHQAHFAPHYLDRNNHTLLITLGCLLESVEIAARHQGWISEYSSNEKDLSTIIRFSKSAETFSEDQNFFSLLSRSTYRGPLKESVAPVLPLDNPEHSDNDVQVKLASSTSLSTSFKKFLSDADSYMWVQTKAAVSFFKEVRFFDDRMGPRGIRSADLGASKMDQVLLYLLSFVPWMLSLIVRIPFINVNFKNASKRNIKNAHFVLVSANDLTASSLINAGREAIRIWVNLEQQGYQVQPYSTASITLVDAATSWLPADTLKKFHTLFTVTGPAACAQQFKLQKNEKPVWMFRVGKK